MIRTDVVTALAIDTVAYNVHLVPRDPIPSSDLFHTCDDHNSGRNTHFQKHTHAHMCVHV